MKILAIEKEKPGVKPEDYSPHLEKEAKIVWQLYKQECIREIYFTNNPQRTLIILEADDEKDARKKLSELPLVKNNLIDFDVYPLHPYPGFERLFK